MDTLAMGGSVLGPAKGAFKDLAQEGIVETFEDYDDLVVKLRNMVKGTGHPDPLAIERFLTTTSWNAFAARLCEELEPEKGHK